MTKHVFIIIKFILYSRTNLPKEIMGFPDFPVPESDKSYLPAKDMLAFLKLYADKHGVTEKIKVNDMNALQNYS